MAQSIVMIVDDDDEIRDALEDVLGGEGYSVFGARDGQQALEFLQSGRHPTAILLDLWMPGMDGCRFREVLLNDVELAKIPIIVLTASRDQRVPMHAVKEILRKPVDLHRLLSVLGETSVSH